MCACMHYIDTHAHIHTDYCHKHLGEMTRTKREHEART